MTIRGGHMSGATVSIAEGKKGFSRLIRDTVEQGENVVITRRGKPVAVIVPYDEYDRTLRTKGYRGILEVRDAFLKAGVVADEVYQQSRAQLEENS